MSLPRIFFVMDPLHTLNIHKDSTLSMMMAAQDLVDECFYVNPAHIFIDEGVVKSTVQAVTIDLTEHDWYQLKEAEIVTFSDQDIIVQRKDPPFDMHYIYVTYLLELAQKQGALVCNDPRSLRDCNEKLFTAWFADVCPITLVTSQYHLLKAFIEKHEDTIIKPLDGMGGTAIFRIQKDDPNLNVILETLTAQQTTTVMMQKYLPAIKNGDKRILIINGEPVPYAMVRIPPKGETRANLAVGGTAVVEALTECDFELCARLAPELKKRGLTFVGLDVIGGYLTEINVTSPTGIRQIENATGIPVGRDLMTVLIDQWKAQRHVS
ncbi:glutathione synthase [Wohlfahrtiimonas chitiniclastica]|uniref:glutathione synthase n=1 Tax=Wohlfahrtiimonas chitiniclastica TaxID=400946 RepID=UPI000B9934A7|nr:glutathione synthase [Wohlfahrtiimonas chitiniclastica]OYQ77842.1 glutathione synthase [Wohlfahrtiimonas chitiniclastica]